MRQITAPKNIHLKNPENGEPMKIQMSDGSVLDALSFRRVAFDLWLADEDRVGKDPVSLARWSAVLAKFSTVVPGNKIKLEDQDYEKLAAIVRSPKYSYGVFAGAQLGPFIDAVLNAETVAEKAK